MAADYLRVHGIDLQREIDTAQNSPAMTHLSTHSNPHCSEDTLIKNVRLSDKHWDVGWDVSIQGGKVDSLELSGFQHGGPGGSSIAFEGAYLRNGEFQVLLPSLCHPHIHLDKCFLLSHPKYVDLEIMKGDFAEALELTSEAKKRFEEDDLITRGKWLIQESIAAGVTHMRAFVEVGKLAYSFRAFQPLFNCIKRLETCLKAASVVETSFRLIWLIKRLIAHSEDL